MLQIAVVAVARGQIDTQRIPVIRVGFDRSGGRIVLADRLAIRAQPIPETLPGFRGRRRPLPVMNRIIGIIVETAEVPARPGAVRIDETL